MNGMEWYNLRHKSMTTLGYSEFGQSNKLIKILFLFQFFMIFQLLKEPNTSQYVQ